MGRCIARGAAASLLILPACFEDVPATHDGGTMSASDSTGGSTADETGGPTAGSTSTGVGTSGSTSATTGPAESGTDDVGEVCRAGEALACDDDELVVCDDDGMGEHTTTCPLGCHDTELRCWDVDPSNDLGELLDLSAREPVLELTEAAVIDTDTGEIVEGDDDVPVVSAFSGEDPEMRVFVVGGFVAQDVTVVGQRSLAIVSHGDIVIDGHLSVSASDAGAGPGAWSVPSCTGLAGIVVDDSRPGSSGGGFGEPGGAGGNAGTAAGGIGGGTVGNAALIPLRGGCDGNPGGPAGRGGGAAQLVSRTLVRVDGILSANGSGGEGGGSGGGLLLEAPRVEIVGNVVANGGAGGCGVVVLGSDAEDGRTDDQPAAGCDASGINNVGSGGNGGAAGVAAERGGDVDVGGQQWAGHGGGGVGRIRLNTADGKPPRTGLFSPAPTLDTLNLR